MTNSLRHSCVQNCMVSQTNAATAAVMGLQHSAHVGRRCADEEGGVDSVTLFVDEFAPSPIKADPPLVAKDASFSIGFFAAAAPSSLED